MNSQLKPLQTDFEEAVYAIDSTAEIHTFDPFINAYDPRVANRKEFTFHSWGLGGIDQNQMLSLNSIMRNLKHDYIDVLKVCGFLI